MNDLRYMISDASKKLQVEAHVLRYWEDELGMEIPRTELGHRYYTQEHLLVFERIKQLKEAGYLLKAIKLIMPKLGTLDEDEFAFISLVSEEMNRMAAGCTSEEAAVSLSGEPYPQAATDLSPEAAAPADPIDNELDCAIRMANSPEAVNDSGCGRASAPVASDAADFSADSGCSRVSEEATPADAQLPSNVIPINRMPAELTHDEKMQQFQAVMTAAVAGAMQSQAQQFGTMLSDQLSAKLLTEINYLLRLRQEQDELHFQQLDETIRSHQKALQEAAASRTSGRRKKKR